MEEPNYEYDWRSPIKVPNPENVSGVSIEKGSFKWFQYWLENEVTYSQVAKKFNTSESSVCHIAKLFKWDERRANREDYLSRQREETLIKNYNKFIETDFKQASLILNGIYKLIEMAFVRLHIIPQPEDMIILELGIDDALTIVKTYPKTARNVYNQILRDLQQPERITKNENEIVDNTPKPLSEVFKNKETINILDSIEYNDE